MRLLWLKTNLLHPVDTGGKIRTYFMLRELKQRHHVTYLALDDGTAAPDAVARAAEYCHAHCGDSPRPLNRIAMTLLLLRSTPPSFENRLSEPEV